ncbi:MAG TPA: type I CRISPR-associated protein Cas7 [bacterium]|nr:type I CRISPR-associated protein Cas7 [bacterium]HPQ19908.1 type I CRISPR-associated protein Cas7 [bacterium]
MNEKKEFKKRVYGCVIIKAINSNYNADFTHQPRTLPDGIVYATDKALKWTVRNYLVKNYSNEKIFFWKRLNEELNPLSIDEIFDKLFSNLSNKRDKNDDKKNKIKRLQKLLECIDIRLFGATYADQKNKINISIHGPVQINHGVNRFPENQIYTEQIMSPFRNPGEQEGSEKAMTTLGSQSKLREGHYVHHFSINPFNLEAICNLITNLNEEKNDLISSTSIETNNQFPKLTEDDIIKLKEGFLYGATYYDSASKAGTENELLLWVELYEKEKIVLPNFTELITINRNNEIVNIDLSKVFELLENVKEKIDNIEIYYNKLTTTIIGLDKFGNNAKVKKYDLYKFNNIKKD